MTGWNDDEVEDSGLMVILELLEILRRVLDLSVLVEMAEVALCRSNDSEGRVEREGGIARGGRARLRP